MVCEEWHCVWSMVCVYEVDDELVVDGSSIVCIGM